MKTVYPQEIDSITPGNNRILERINIIASRHDGKCLSSHYENIRQKLLWECRKGHKWFASVNSVLYSGSWCPYCAGNRKLSLTELQQLAAQKGGRCLTTQYANSKTKLFWQCNKGHQWQATAFSIKIRESWCPVCYKINLKPLKTQVMKTSKKLSVLYLIAAAVIMLGGCAVIRPGEVALKVRYGKIQPVILLPGAYAQGIIGTRIKRFDTRVTEYSSKIGFHSSEGIEVTSEITMLYHLIPDSVISIYQKFDGYYQNTLIINNLITALRQEGLNHKAIELITQRNEIEQTIKEKLTATIGKYGFSVDLVLMKDIDLPAEVTTSIQAKLTAEQVSKKTEIDLEIQRKNLDYQIEKQKKEAELEVAKQRIGLDFVIEKQKKESERLLIESEAIKKSQDILNSSITDMLIKYKALDITKELMKSPNAKIIITDGKSPVILSDK
jgi:regulator of protease activity HflC (stomatin/prohibitin superfamily)